jgi:prepilin-type N-terminal cleavage/methylation domain-containing protein
VFAVVKYPGKKSGFTLTELLIVMAVIVILVGLSVPAVKKIAKSFETTAGVRSVISAALCNARAIAAKEQRYVGLRFQQDVKGRQYMIFIIHDPAPAPTQGDLTMNPLLTGTGLANGFRALDGRKPIALPENAGVMDLRVKSVYTGNPYVEMDIEVPGDDAGSDGHINDDVELRDTMTFSVVFSPAGKLVVHDVRVRNRTGRIKTDSDAFNLGYNPYNHDDVFNTVENLDNGLGLFYQDDYIAYGLVQEKSRNCFVVYDRKEFAQIAPGKRWSDYLKDLAVLYVNPYTGELINK